MSSTECEPLCADLPIQPASAALIYDTHILARCAACCGDRLIVLGGWRHGR